MRGRDDRYFLLGALVGATVMAVLQLLPPLPWWITIPLGVYGLWRFYTLGRDWHKEWRDAHTGQELYQLECRMCGADTVLHNLDEAKAWANVHRH